MASSLGGRGPLTNLVCGSVLVWTTAGLPRGTQNLPQPRKSGSEDGLHMQALALRMKTTRERASAKPSAPIRPPKDQDTPIQHFFISCSVEVLFSHVTTHRPTILASLRYLCYLSPLSQSKNRNWWTMIFLIIIITRWNGPKQYLGPRNRR